MPYDIREFEDGFKVCKENTKKCFSKDTLPYEKAYKQRQAIGISGGSMIIKAPKYGKIEIGIPNMYYKDKLVDSLTKLKALTTRQKQKSIILEETNNKDIVIEDDGEELKDGIKFHTLKIKVPKSLIKIKELKSGDKEVEVPTLTNKSKNLTMRNKIRSIKFKTIEGNKVKILDNGDNVEIQVPTQEPEKELDKEELDRELKKLALEKLDSFKDSKDHNTKNLFKPYFNAVKKFKEQGKNPDELLKIVKITPYGVKYNNLLYEGVEESEYGVSEFQGYFGIINTYNAYLDLVDDLSKNKFRVINTYKEVEHARSLNPKSIKLILRQYKNDLDNTDYGEIAKEWWDKVKTEAEPPKKTKSILKGGNQEETQDILEFDTRYAKQPVATLKQVLTDYANEKNINIEKINKMKKQELIDKLRELKFNPQNLPAIQPRVENVLKRYSTKAFTDEEQKKFEEEGYKIINPLKAKSPYLNPKTGKQETTELQKHQEKFITKWILSNFTGAIVFHGVGTGKTITAVVASHYYLSVYPKNKVVIVSPPALLYNSITAMIQYGLNIRDKRYSFYTYDKFIKVADKIVDDNTLIIVDEAHILRSYISVSVIEDRKGQDIEVVSQGKRAYFILKAIKNCHKSLLLTGTPFVNILYDIENLISMVDKKNPLTQNDFAQITTSIDGIGNDYFKYKISHYENPAGSEFFPRVNNELVPLYLEEDDEEYRNIEQGKNPFYVYTRQLSEQIDGLKVDWVMNLLNKDRTKKTILYTTFIDASAKMYINAMRKAGIQYSVISGKENKQQKEEARVAYNKNEVQVLLISKAGTEGVDTQGTTNMVILESQFNEALTNQAIARAVRFKSHYHLPKAEQYVNVYRLLVAKPHDKELINEINKSLKGQGKELDYTEIMLKIRKADAEAKALGADLLDEDGNLDKRKARKLPPALKEKAFKGLKFNRYEVDNALNDIFKDLPAVDVRLLIMSLAKQQVINDFINVLDKNVPSIEDYSSPLEEKVNQAIKKGIKPEEILKIQSEELQKQKNVLIKNLDDPKTKLNQKLKKVEEIAQKQKEKASKVKRFQEFFTPDTIVKEMISKSKRLQRSFKKLNVLEPTAGSGNIVKGVLKKFSNCHIDMVEIQDDNRAILEDLVKVAPDILTLMTEGDFLKFVNPSLYDLIIMNPPYHLYKKLNPNLDRDYYDMDFVEKSYKMLEVEGEIIALVRKENREKPQYANWLKSLDNVEMWDLNDQKWDASNEKGELSKISSINLTIIRIIRTKKEDITKPESVIMNTSPTEKLEADIQQKLELPVSQIPQIVNDIKKNKKTEEAQDVKEILQMEVPQVVEKALYKKNQKKITEYLEGIKRGSGLSGGDFFDDEDWTDIIEPEKDYLEDDFKGGNALLDAFTPRSMLQNPDNSISQALFNQGLSWLGNKLLGGAIPINKKLYEKAKEIVYPQYKKPSAYRSGAVIKKYKELGGKFKEDGERKLKRWFREEWKDIGNKEYPVFRPTKRITKDTPLTPDEIDPENLRLQIKEKQKIKGEKNLKPFKGGALYAKDKYATGEKELTQVEKAKVKRKFGEGNPEVKEIQQEPMGDDDIRKYFPNAKILKYSELSKYNDITQLLPKPKSFFFLLYERQPNVGHWVLVSRYIDNGIDTIEFFCSYGSKIDEPLSWIPIGMRKILGEDKPYLSMLLDKSPFRVIYNPVQFQAKRSKISTCGAYNVLRASELKKHDTTLEEFNEMLEEVKKATGLTYDEIVSNLITIR